MIYTDGTHLTGDTLEELHAFARSIGMRRAWFQDHRHPHYDLKGRMRQKAIDAGALLLDTRTLVTISCQGKAFCSYCDRDVLLYHGRFVPHGDSLGPCPNAGRKP